MAHSANGPWYFAYGANMAESVFIQRRQIKPLRTEPARINTHKLCFNVMGIPYEDPGQGGLRELEDVAEGANTNTESCCVHGVAYLLTQEDLARVIASEGGGVAYRVIQAEAILLKNNSVVSVATLIGRRNVSPTQERLPSKRYMGLLVSGAAAQGLPQWYQDRLIAQPTFQPMDTTRYKLGMRLFLPFWQKMGMWVGQGISRFKSADGHVPGWFVFTFDMLLWAMWTYHDYVHGPLFGRGDGLQTSRVEASGYEAVSRSL